MILKGDETRYRLGAHVQILEDPTCKLTFEQVRTEAFNQRFVDSHDVVPNFGFTPSDYWIRFKLRTESVPPDDWVLEIGNPLLTSLQLFLIDDDGKVEVKETGKEVPFDKREIPARDFLFKPSLKQGATKTIYAHISGQDNKLFNLILWKREVFEEALRITDVVMGFYFGILFALMAYNLFLFFSIRDVSYLYYIGFVGSAVFLRLYIASFGWQYLAGDTVFNEQTFLLGNMFGIFFVIMFSLRFLNIKTFYPIIYKVALAYMFGMIVFLGVGLYPPYYLSVMKFSSLLIIPGLLFLIVIGIVLINRGYRPAYYFIIGWSAIATALIVMLLKHTGYLPVNLFTQHVVKVATAFEAIIFSLGLGDRFHTTTLQLNLKTLESKKFEETEKMKSDFFSNISHELRTPLALIITPLETLIKGPPEQPAGLYKIMHRNAQRLLQLVNQLLDLSKLDNKAMKLKLFQGNLMHELKIITSYFDSAAEEKGIAFQCTYAQEELITYYDREKIETILLNILSNAFKFTPAGGRVFFSAAYSLYAHGAEVKFIVQDTGIGIEKDSIDKIFDRFYQVNNTSVREYEGTGIGLSLVNELVNLHRGSIQVVSELSKGSEFIITLPLSPEYFNKDEFDISETSSPHQKVKAPTGENHVANDSDTPRDEMKPTLLLAEDNRDFRAFTKGTLQAEYNIQEAPDGLMAWEKILADIPDLVIADMMMPKMDGAELCKKIKGDIRTSHIPVIILTARMSVDSKIKGLETGADDYLTKPFLVEELQARVQNLILQREKLREAYKKEIWLKPKDVAITPASERFLNSLINAIELNLSSQEFNVEKLGQEIGMSRTQIFKKLKAITGESPSEFIRHYKLSKGAELLSKKAFDNIAEVAYACGFSSPSHFTESFRKQFGKSPSEFTKNPS